MMPMITSSGTSAPESIKALAFTPISVRFHRFTKNVTGADSRDVQLVAYDLGLRALTGAGRA